MYLFVTHLAHTSILLGYPWFLLHDAVIRPRKGIITFDCDYCNKHCQTSPTTLRLHYERNVFTPMPPRTVQDVPVIATPTRAALEAPAKPTLQREPIHCAQISAVAFQKFAKRKDHQIFSCSLQDLERAIAPDTETGEKELPLPSTEVELAEPTLRTPT